MTTAKTFDIHDYDFLYEEEVNNLEAETFQEASPSCARTHETASGKQKSETGVRQALTDTARKAQEKGNELWKSTENVRKNTARAAKKKARSSGTARPTRGRTPNRSGTIRPNGSRKLPLRGTPAP